MSDYKKEITSKAKVILSTNRSLEQLDPKAKEEFYKADGYLRHSPVFEDLVPQFEDKVLSEIANGNIMSADEIHALAKDMIKSLPSDEQRVASVSVKDFFTRLASTGKFLGKSVFAAVTAGANHILIEFDHDEDKAVATRGGEVMLETQGEDLSGNMFKELRRLMYRNTIDPASKFYYQTPKGVKDITHYIKETAA